MSLARAVLNGDPIAAASAVALRHVSDEAPGIRRYRRGKGFHYTTPHGKAVRDGATLSRIRSLAIPPAWTAVWTGGPFTSKNYRTWAATTSAAILFCWLEHPSDKRSCKRCVQQVLAAVAERLGHTPAVCRASYIHPRVIDDFTSGALGALARQIRHRLPGGGTISAGAIGVDVLRAIEPLVARYLDGAGRRRRA